jgi:large subunit ribosomal protein L15
LTVNYATPVAKAEIEKAGGSVTLIEKKVLPADEAKRAKTAKKKAATAKPKATAGEE